MPRLTRFVCLALALLLVACGVEPTAVPTQAPTPSLTPTPAPSATASPSPTPTLLPSPTITLTPLPSGPFALGTPFPRPGKELGPANAKALDELARWGRGRAQQVEYSPDGQWLVVKTAQNSYVYPARAPSTAQEFEGSLNFAPNSQIAANVTGYGQVDVWAVAGWKRLGSSRGSQVAFSADGAFVAVAGAQQVDLVSTTDGKVIRSLAHSKANRVLFGLNGATLLTSGRDSLRIWQTGDGKLVKRLDYDLVQRAVLTRDGNLLLVQGRNYQNEALIDVYKTDDWSLASSIFVSSPFVLQPDGSQLFVYSNVPTTGRIEVFSLPDGIPVRDMKAGGSVYRLAVSPDSQVLAASIVDFSPSSQQTISYLKTFDLSSGKELKRLECGIACDPQQPVFSPDGKLLAVKGVSSASGLYVGSTFLFAPRTGERVRTLRGPKIVAGNIEQAVFTPDGQTLATLTGRADDAIRQWKVADGSLLHTLEWGADTLTLGNVTADGKLLATYSDAGVTRLLNSANGATVSTVQKALEPQFSPRADWLVVAEPVAGRAETLRLVRTADGTTLTTFPRTFGAPFAFSSGEDVGATLKDFSVQLVKLPSGGFAGSLSATGKANVKLSVGAFSPDGKLLAGGSVNGEVWLWSLAEKKQLRILEGHKINVTAVLFGPDGKLLLSGSSDGAVYLWDVNKGTAVKIFQVNELARRASEAGENNFGQLAALALSPDGKLLAVSGYLNPLQPAPTRAGVVALISVDSGELLRLLPGGGGNVAFAPDGKILWTSGDGAVHAWGLNE